MYGTFLFWPNKRIKSIYVNETPIQILENNSMRTWELPVGSQHFHICNIHIGISIVRLFTHLTWYLRLSGSFVEWYCKRSTGKSVGHVINSLISSFYSNSLLIFFFKWKNWLRQSLIVIVLWKKLPGTINSLRQTPVIHPYWSALFWCSWELGYQSPLFQYR